MNNFKFKKKYGQNFLKNQDIIEKIVSSISPKENDLIIEIGPGGGAITKKLRRYNSYLIAYEIDKETSKFLNKLENKKTKIIYHDFLDENILEDLKNYNYNNLFIIGNLPYYITTPIIEKIIKSNLNEESITIMVQKEVADRFLAKPGNKNYSSITVLLAYNYNIEKICDVKRDDFTPIPNVDSTVIKLNKKDKEEINYEYFKKILRDAFQYKRKTLNNNLKNYDKVIVSEILSKYKLTLSDRAENLPLEAFIDLSKKLF